MEELHAYTMYEYITQSSFCVIFRNSFSAAKAT